MVHYHRMGNFISTSSSIDTSLSSSSINNNAINTTSHQVEDEYCKVVSPTNSIPNNTINILNTTDTNERSIINTNISQLYDAVSKLIWR